MKRLNLFVLCVLITAFAIGCAQGPKSQNASEAIDHAQTLQSVEDQAKYLVSEANGFINSKQFDEAIKSAKYILSKLDAESKEAQSIIEKAQAELKKMAEEKAAEMKAKLNSALGK